MTDVLLLLLGGGLIYGSVRMARTQWPKQWRKRQILGAFERMVRVWR